MISFPGFGISLNINRIAFNIFGVDIYWYAICIVFAIIISVLLCCKSKEKYKISSDFIIETLSIAIIFGIIGARFYYVLFNLDYYFQNLLNIFKVRDGGLAIFGGLILGIISVAIKCKVCKVNFFDMLDLVAPFVALGQSIGRWGNFFNQEAYGTKTNSIFKMGIFVQNDYIEVHPTFLYESICTFAIFLILRKIQKNRRFKGQIVLLYLFMYSSVRIFIEGLRIDSLMLKNYRVSQILSVAICVISSILLSKCYIKSTNLRKK